MRSLALCHVDFVIAIEPDPPWRGPASSPATTFASRPPVCSPIISSSSRRYDLCSSLEILILGGGVPVEDFKVSPDALWQVQKALREYEHQVNGSQLSQHAKDTCLTHTRHFVRWLEGKFDPGGTLA
jgi:hypothetical protein